MDSLLIPKQCSGENRIKLDIGGKLFHVSKETLLKQSGFFASMFSGKFSILPEPDGVYFIDRDSKLFPCILNYLRNGQISLEHLKKSQLELLHLEAVYYSIESLQKQIESYECGCRRGFMHGTRYDITIRNDFKKLTDPFIFEATKPANKLSGNRIWNVTILGNAIYLADSGVYEFFIKINVTSYGNIMIGVAGINIDQSLEANHKNSGWYLSRTGRLHTDEAQGVKNEAFELKDIKFLNGSIIGWRVDLIRNTLSVSYNFGEFILAFESIVVGEGVRPCILLYDNGDSVSISNSVDLQGDY